jgi:two-component system, NarL family, response regulator LiaR
MEWVVLRPANAAVGTDRIAITGADGPLSELGFGSSSKADVRSMEGRLADPITVLVVDDDHGFRAAMGRMLADRGFDVVGDASDGWTAVSLVRTLAPAVVVMDLQMPRFDGIEATRVIADSCPASAVLMLTVSAENGHLLDAMLAGARGYLLKGSSPDALVAGIEAAARGELMLSAGVASKLVARLRTVSAREAGDMSTISFLSARELEVLGLLAAGRPNDDIASQLKISPFTVRNHVSNLLRKLDVENRTQAAAFAARHGL